MTRIDVDPPDDESARLWASVGDLADLLPPHWVLIGGLRAQIHALERGVEDVRATTDIDVLGQARPQGPLRAIDEALRADGFEPDLPDLHGYAFRYSRDGLIVDLLAPDDRSSFTTTLNPSARTCCCCFRSSRIPAPWPAS